MEELELIVYSGAECCLCDDARVVLDELAPRLGVRVEWRMIDGDPELERTWRELLPAGVLGGRRIFKYHVDPAVLERRVAELRRVGAQT